MTDLLTNVVAIDAEDAEVIETTGPNDPADVTFDDVINQLRADIEEAQDWAESELSLRREKSQKYYNGETDLPVAGENRSKYVATKVRDTIRAVKPDLIRTLLSSPRPVEFVPTNIQAAPLAAQQSDYVMQLFHRCGGYKAVYDAIHTSCLHSIGVVKVYEDVKRQPEFTSYSGLTPEQVQQVRMAHPESDVTIADTRMVQVPGPQGVMEVEVNDVEVVTFKERRKICLESMSPEEFIIDEFATDVDDFRVIAHRRDVRVGDAVAMGFDMDDLLDLDGEDPELYDHQGLSTQRRRYSIDENDEDSADPTMQKFLLTEAYYYADLDGLGVPQLFRFWLGGTNYRYLTHERVEEHPFCLFALDPEPFTVYGHSLFEIVSRDQDVLTSLTRAVVDNAHQSNNPRLAIHETMVNVEDVLNNDIAAPIRFRQPGMIQPIDIPFTGAQLLPLLQYLNEQIDNKTGVTRASIGLDPAALQSTQKDAVQNTIAKQAGQIELMARNLAETGMMRLMRCLLRLTLQNPNPMAVMKIRGSFVPVPLDQFDPDLDMIVNVGTGNAPQERKAAAMQGVIAMQEKVMSQYGPGNPVVSMSQMYNAVEDALVLSGIHDTQRYFTPLTPQAEQQFAQQMQAAAQQNQQQPQQQDPTQAIIQAETIKTQGRLQEAQMKGQIDIQKAQANHQLDVAKLQAEETFKRRDAMRQDDLDRDKMYQDMAIRLAELEAQMAMQARSDDVKADVVKEQARQRPQGGN